GARGRPDRSGAAGGRVGGGAVRGGRRRGRRGQGRRGGPPDEQAPLILGGWGRSVLGRPPARSSAARRGPRSAFRWRGGRRTRIGGGESPNSPPPIYRGFTGFSPQEPVTPLRRMRSPYHIRFRQKVYAGGGP